MGTLHCTCIILFYFTAKNSFEPFLLFSWGLGCNPSCCVKPYVQFHSLILDVKLVWVISVLCCFLNMLYSDIESIAHARHAKLYSTIIVCWHVLFIF